FLGGSRLNRFMETVESATAAIPEEMIEDSEEALRSLPEPDFGARGGARGRAGDGRRRRRGPPPLPVRVPEPEPDSEEEAAAADPGSALLEAGMGLLQQLAGAALPAAGGPAAPHAPNGAGAVRSFVARDERTGETYLKLPVPPPEVIDQALQAFGALLQGLRR